MPILVVKALIKNNSKVYGSVKKLMDTDTKIINVRCMKKLFKSNYKIIRSYVTNLPDLLS